MKWIFDRCRRHRQELGLLASGLLSDSDRTRVENHLATCADCRSYFYQIKTVTVPLAGWEKHFEHVEVGATAQLRLATAIQSTGRPKIVQLLTPKVVLLNCWQQLVWPSRRTWAGLAAVWLLMLTVNLSMRDHLPANSGMSTPSPEMFSSFQQQEKILAELMGPNEPRVALPPQPFLPQPSSQRRFEMLTV